MEIFSRKVFAGKVGNISQGMSLRAEQNERSWRAQSKCRFQVKWKFTSYMLFDYETEKHRPSAQRGDDVGKLENLCYTCLSIKPFLFLPVLAVQGLW
jgi:hypothetical protein